MNSILTTLALALPLFTFAPQDSDAADPHSNLVRLSELTVTFYTPQHADTNMLVSVAARMFGRKFFVQERGGYASDPVSNISSLGRELILYDTLENVKRLEQTLASLDRPTLDSKQALSSDLTTSQFTPQHITVAAAIASVVALSRYVDDRPNLTAVRGRRRLVIRDTVERVKEIQELLQAVDVPEDQVRLTCYLLQGTTAAEEEPGVVSAPKSVLDELAKLVPGIRFESVGFAMLQTAVVEGSQVGVSMDGPGNSRFELTFFPQAYDQKDGGLTVRNCRVTRHERLLGAETGPTSSSDTILTTDTVFRGDRYTVLGATGSEPIFIVVHVTRVR